MLFLKTESYCLSSRIFFSLFKYSRFIFSEIWFVVNLYLLYTYKKLIISHHKINLTFYRISTMRPEKLEQEQTLFSAEFTSSFRNRCLAGNFSSFNQIIGGSIPPRIWKQRKLIFLNLTFTTSTDKKKYILIHN